MPMKGWLYLNGDCELLLLPGTGIERGEPNPQVRKGISLIKDIRVSLRVHSLAMPWK